MKQNKCFKIAITGGIGSGKSTICNILKEYNYPVYSCDEVYNNLLSKGYFDNELKNIFGERIFDNGKISKRKLIEIVKSDPDKLNILSKMTNKAIIKEIINLAKDDKVAFFEVPLLFEGKFQSKFDKIIVVLRDKDERINAVIQRDKKQRIDVLNAINNQVNYENLSFAEYYVIHNNSNYNDLHANLDIILDKLGLSR